MKKGILILVLVLTYMQMFSQEPPKKANVIIIKTVSSIDDAFLKTGRLLMSEGYGMESSDKTFYAITSKILSKSFNMQMNSLNMQLYFQFDKGDSTTILISGKFEDTTYGNKNDNNLSSIIENKGAKSSTAGKAWFFMNEFCDKLNLGSLYYSTK